MKRTIPYLVAFVFGLVALTAVVGATETTVTIRNQSDRMVVVNTQATVHSSIVKYCVASLSEGHLRGVHVISVAFMEGHECSGKVAKEYATEGTAQFLEASGVHGVYRLIERSRQ